VGTSEIREVRRSSSTWKRVSFGAILALVALQILLFLYLVTVGWQFRNLMLPPAPEIAVRIRTVVANGVWLGGNVLAAAAYMLGRRQVGRYVLLVVLAFDLVNSVFAAVGFLLIDDSTTAVGWLAAALIPLVAMVLLWHQPGEEINAH
jgi:hypothetical protein